MRQLVPIKSKTNDCVQTPLGDALKIVKHFKPTGKILEPCRGDGNFLKAIKIYGKNKKGLKYDWCEIKNNKDFFEYKRRVDWIITNPPYSIIRKFMQKSMLVSDNIVFLTSINHLLGLKARMKDIENYGFGIKEIFLMDTPSNFPSSGFQMGCFHIQRGYKRYTKITR